jgi:hypothetical protein
LSRVERIWRQPIRARNSLEIVQIKLKNVKNDLKGWGQTLEGEIRRGNKRKQELHLELVALDELEENGLISRTQTCRKTQIQVEFLHMLEKEEAFWQQRSRE